jgi:hypothetical protein
LKDKARKPAPFDFDAVPIRIGNHEVTMVRQPC